MLGAIVASLATFLYWLAERKNQRLEHELGERLIEENERRNSQDMESSLRHMSDAELFTEAVKRGIHELDEVPKLPRDSGDKS